MNKINKTFKKFFKFLSLGFACLILFYVAQINITSGLLEKGPSAVLADEENCNQSFWGCDNPGTDEGSGLLPDFPEFNQPAPAAPVAQPAPVTPAAPQAPTPACNEDVTYCDDRPGIGKNIHKHGGYWDGSQCVYAFDQLDACGQPAPEAPAPQSQAPAPAPQAPQPAAPQPAAPAASCPVNGACCFNPIKTCSSNSECPSPYNWCYSGVCIHKDWNGSSCAPQGAPIAPPAPVTPPAAQLPECRSLATNTVCGGQKAYDTCHEFTQGGVKFLSCVASQNPNCSGVIQCSAQPAAPVTPTQTQTTQCPSGTTAITATNNVITCISNQQQQTQTQTAQGGNASAVINIPGGIVSRTEIIREQPVAIQVAKVECPAGTVKKVVDREVICEVTGRAVATVAGAKELPKTGLPALAWGLAALVPLGMKLRGFSKFSRTNLISTPGYIWEDRQFKR